MSTEAQARGLRRLYLDASAYLGLLLGEPRTAALAASTADAELLSSVLLIIEARRNLIRLARERGITGEQYVTCMQRVEQDIQRFTLRELTLDLCDVAPMPAIATPRSLDLVHLRTAAWFHSTKPIDRFVTFDSPQEQAARELGLPV